jgi:hypothetical protein
LTSVPVDPVVEVVLVVTLGSLCFSWWLVVPVVEVLPVELLEESDPRFL